MVSRRSLLLGSALGTGVLALMRGVRATTVEQVAPAAQQPPLASACRFDAKHERLAADLRAKLASTGMDPGSEITIACPLCGCPITVASN